MALVLKPHTATVKAASQAVTGSDTAAPPAYSAGTSIGCQITPLPMQEAYDRAGVELTRPHLLLCDLTYADLFGVGGRVVWGSRTFHVAAHPKRWEADALTSCCEVFLDELDFV